MTEPIQTVDDSIWSVSLTPEVLLEELAQQQGYTHRIGVETDTVVLHELMQDGWVIYQWRAINNSKHEYGTGGTQHIERHLLKDGNLLFTSCFKDRYSTYSDDSEDHSQQLEKKTQLFVDDPLAVALYRLVEREHGKN